MIKIITISKIIVVALILSLGVFYAQAAWTNPPANPPSNNVDAPINVGTSPQRKGGTALPGSLLDINGLLSSNSLSVFGDGSFTGDVNVGGGTITGLQGGVSIGAADKGWYSDNVNLSARVPSTNGLFYVQGPKVGTVNPATYATIGPVSAIFNVDLQLTGDAGKELYLFNPNGTPPSIHFRNNTGGNDFSIYQDAASAGQNLYFGAEAASSPVGVIGRSGFMGSNKFCELDGTSCIDPDQVVGATCSNGQYLQGFNSDGTRKCAPDQSGPGGGTVTGGNGLTSVVSTANNVTNTTLNIVATAGANAGILVNTNDIGIDYTKVQKKVSEVCAAGSSIRQINADGTVECETDDSDTSTGDLSGSGTTNTVPLWTGTKSLGNSLLKQALVGSVTNMGIGSVLSNAKLNVDGGLAADSLTVFGQTTLTSAGSVTAKLVSGAEGAYLHNNATDFLIMPGDASAWSSTIRPFTVTLETGDVNIGKNALYVNHAGNVGVGTVSPNTGLKLGVNGNVGATAYCDVNNANCFTPGTVITGAGTAGYVSKFSGPTDINNSIIYQDASSNVGIGRGVGPLSAKLDVNGSIKGSAFYYSSDKNLKTNIVTLPSALDKIKALRGVSFNWKDTGRKDIGVIAQEVEKVFPEAVLTDKSTGLKSVEYGNLVAPLIEAIKEQQKQIEELKKEVETLKNK